MAIKIKKRGQEKDFDPFKSPIEEVSSQGRKKHNPLQPSIPKRSKIKPRKKTKNPSKEKRLIDPTYSQGSLFPLSFRAPFSQDQQSISAGPKKAVTTNPSAQETFTQETSTQETLTQETSAQETLTQETFTQETFTQETLTQETLTQETLTQEISLESESPSIQPLVQLSSALDLSVNSNFPSKLKVNSRNRFIPKTKQGSNLHPNLDRKLESGVCLAARLPHLSPLFPPTLRAQSQSAIPLEGLRRRKRNLLLRNSLSFLIVLAWYLALILKTTT